MIKIVGTNHEDSKKNGFRIDERHRLDFFDKIFTEGFSKQGWKEFNDFIDDRLAENPFYTPESENGRNRGAEPWKFDELDQDVIYLDDYLSPEVKEEMLIASMENPEDSEAYPMEFIGKKISRDEESREAYLNFMRKIRDMAFEVDQGDSSYYALNEDGFKKMIEVSAEHIGDQTPEEIRKEKLDYEKAFLEGIEKYDIEFPDYVDVHAESRPQFQDKRDQEWYEQITGQIDQENNVLLVTGIHHALDHDETIRGLLEEEYDVNTASYRNS